MNWQQELRQQLDAVPGGAERLLRAIDEGRLHWSTYGVATDCGTRACAYGHIYGDHNAARDAALRHRTTCELLSMECTELENAVADHKPLIRPEVVAWLAEFGSRASRVTPQLQEQNQR